MTSDKTRKTGSGKSEKIAKIAEKPAKGKTAAQYDKLGGSAGAGARKALTGKSGLQQPSRAGRRGSRPALNAGLVKAKPSSSGNVRQLRPRKPAHDGWGPFYDSSGVAELLDISPAEAEKQGEMRELLMVNTTDGRFLFPVWQFTDDHLHRRVAKVLTVFRDLSISPWMVVQWATAPNPELGDVTPVEWLRGNQPTGPVLEDARAYAARWSR
ncbi:hypothetical protein [Streptomyces longisporus]|uniref:DUF2384 domain-containing protein n=1 Tax=Streptomyces longisporus TaxID=1948 RepID=A0ABN3NJD0_STRLO